MSGTLIKAPAINEGGVAAMKEIRYVKQPNAYWCGQACVAMLAGVPVEEVVSILSI